MTLAEWVAPFVPVADYPVDVWYAGVSRYHRARGAPRFFAARTYLSAVGIHAATIDECVCVLKRRWIMGQGITDLVLPPMSIHGDTATERRIVRDCLALGVGVRVTRDDARALDLADTAIRWGHAEYIYTASDQSTRRTRERHRYAIRTYEAGLWEHAPIPTPEAADDLVTRWAEQNDKPRRSVRAAIRAWIAADAPGTCHAITNADGRLDALHLCEDLPGGAAAATVGIHDRRCGLPDTAAYLHDLEMQAHTPGTRVNTGAAIRGPGHVAFKERLHPTTHLVVGRAVPTHPIARDEWIAAKPGTAPTLFA